MDLLILPALGASNLLLEDPSLAGSRCSFFSAPRPQGPVSSWLTLKYRPKGVHHLETHPYCGWTNTVHFETMVAAIDCCGIYRRFIRQGLLAGAKWISSVYSTNIGMDYLSTGARFCTWRDMNSAKQIPPQNVNDVHQTVPNQISIPFLQEHPF